MFLFATPNRYAHPRGTKYIITMEVLTEFATPSIGIGAAVGVITVAVVIYLACRGRASENGSSSKKSKPRQTVYMITLITSFFVGRNQELPAPATLPLLLPKPRTSNSLKRRAGSSHTHFRPPTTKVTLGMFIRWRLNQVENI